LAVHCTVAIPSKPEFKIAGGTASTVKDYPFLVRIVADDKHLCTGSLISDRWVLTAAHCIVDGSAPKENGVAPIRHASQFKLNIGKDDVDSITVILRERYVHEDYNAADFSNDVALLRLEDPVDFTDEIQPVKLMRDIADLPPNWSLTAAGWGIDDETQKSV